MLAIFRLAVVLVGLMAQVCVADEVDFNRDILPILSDHCFQCHGPDANVRQADLRLDLKDGLYEDRGGYAAVVPNDPANSELLTRISSDDSSEIMPPPESKLALSERKKELLRRWIADGATWSEHWAFVKPENPTPPEIANPNWAINGLDLFVLQKIEDAGLTPSPPADRVTQIRRVTLDLTGIPPTPQEVDAFVNDDSPNAYEKVVDRLLSSPRYGERMAWEWLDAARYADTDGFQADPTRDMWPWRDWLIQALNDNMPFDQFTIEMLAGDLLPDASHDQILATAFNRNHMYNGEGGRIPEETRVENVFDRTETTATVWLGLTMTCARCHDHKFDPISHREYYELFAFFDNTTESGAGGSGKARPTMRFYTPDQQARLAELQQQVEQLSETLNGPDEVLDRRQAKWETESVAKVREYLKQNDVIGLGDWWMVGPFPAPDGDGSKSFDHEFAPESEVDLDASYLEGKLKWKVASDFADGTPHELPDTVGATYLYRELTASTPRSVEIGLGSDDALIVWLNGEKVLGKNVARAVAPNQERLTVDLNEGTNELLMKIVNTGGMSAFYFAKQNESVSGMTPDVSEALLIPQEHRTKRQLALLRDHYRAAHSKPWQEARRKQAELNGQRQAIADAAPQVMIMDSLPGYERETAILDRGTYNKPLDLVSASTPDFLPELPEGRPANRLALAEWIVDPNHPLTARVTVNRYWQMFFGMGLVKTAEDFGRQGELPSHPDLLDWLACTFVESGWDVKAMHKLIVMSATYRQSSRDVERLSYETDPENRWLARGSRFRMPSWMLRDQALALSGLMVEKRGGPPVNPYQPDGIWAEATFGKIQYQQGSGDDLYRRSLYTFWRRIVGPTMFFDQGKRQTCLVKPSRTNSPLHALTTLNDITFVEAARVMATQLVHADIEIGDEKSKEVNERIALAFRMATGRNPEQDELDRLVARWHKLHAKYSANPEAATELINVGESPTDQSIDPASLASYSVVCLLILNLDEVLTRE